MPVRLGGQSAGYMPIDQVAQRAGVPIVAVHPNWKSNSRTGGTRWFPDKGPYGITVHHTAGGDFTRDFNYCAFVHPDRPVGNILLGPDGIGIIAAGPSNCQGVGGPRQTSKGTIPADQGNMYSFAIEASNNGVGQPWPSRMQDFYTSFCAVACVEWGLVPGDVHSHHEWTPPRKIDPRGPARFQPANQALPWDMNAFRAEVNQKYTLLTVPIPKPDPNPQPSPGGDMDDILFRFHGTDNVWHYPSLVPIVGEMLSAKDYLDEAVLVVIIHQQLCKTIMNRTGLKQIDFGRTAEVLTKYEADTYAILGFDPTKFKQG